MLDRIRDNKNNTFIAVIVGVIVVVFIGWGSWSSSGMNQGASVVARVNGKNISTARFARQVGNRLDRMRRFSKRRPSAAEEAIVRQTVLDQMIEGELLRQEAARVHVVVSDQELREYILSRPYLKDDRGKFDKRAYKRLTRRYPRFEDDQREGMVLARMESLIKDSVSVSEADLRQLYDKENTKINLEYVKFSSREFGRKYDVSDEEVKTFIAERMEDIRTRYDRDFNAKYNIPKKIRARHILIKLDKDDSEVVQGLAREKIQQIAELIKSRDFAELAKEYSEDPGSAPRGGDLGLFDEKRMAPEFSEAAFSLGVGEVSGVVETSFGLHLIKVEEVHEAEVKSLESVQAQIAKDLIKEEKGPELARAAAERVRGLWRAGGEPLTSALAEYDLSVRETGMTTVLNNNVRGIGSSAELATVALSLREGDPAPEKVFDVPNALVLIRLKERAAPDEAGFEAAKSRLMARVKQQKQEQVYQTWIQSLRDKAQIEMLNPRALEPA